MISATQIKTAALCPRKWAWQYITGIKPPETAAKALGSRVHEILALYLTDGTPPNPLETYRFDTNSPTRYPGKIALDMINGALPKPGVGAIEQKFTWKHNGIDYIGFIDCLLPKGRSAIGETVTIIDHKVSSDPQKYGVKTLLADPQAILYAAYAAAVFAPDAVKCSWNYGSSTLKKSGFFIVHDAALVNVIKEKFETYVEPTAFAIKHWKQTITDPRDLPYNADACSVYGVCEYRSNCALTTQERLGAFIMGSSLVEELLAASRAGGGHVDPALAAKLGVPAENTTATPPQSGLIPAKPADDGINPPEVEETPPPTEAVPATPPAEATPATPPAEAAPATPPAAEALQKRRRARKSATAPATPPAADAVATETLTATVTKGLNSGALDDAIDGIIDLIVARALKRIAERLQ